MVNNYNLVNPLIKGKVETNIKAKNSREAASIIYTNISEHFNNAIPAFYFSIQKGNDGKFYHFKVNERKNNNEINFNINEIQLENDNYMKKEFKAKLEKIKEKMDNQDGGRKKTKKKKSKKKVSSEKSEDSSSIDSSDSDDLYIRTKKYYYSEPIYWWWYDPLVYRLDKVFLPTFYSYVTPLVQLDTTSVSLGSTTVTVGP